MLSCAYTYLGKRKKTGFLQHFVCLLMLVLVTLFTIPSSKADEKPHVVFLCPSSSDFPFFVKTVSIMKAAAKSLDLKLEVLYGEHDPMVMQQRANELLTRENKPDYLVLVNHRDLTADIMRKADDQGVRTLLFNGAFPSETFNRFKSGPEKLNHWIGQVLPDEVQSGYLLARHLIEHASQQLESLDKTVEVVGLNGAARSPTSELRLQGLKNYIAENERASLKQVIHANWDLDLARNLSKKLLQRFPNTSVIWAASDHMAVGATLAIRDSGKIPGEQVITAGIDWLPVAFEPTAKGELYGSVGGHIYDAAWAMTVIYDYSQKEIESFVDERTSFYFADQAKMDTVKQIMSPEYWNEIDYKQFSKMHSEGKDYVFGVHLVLPKLP